MLKIFISLFRDISGQKLQSSDNFTRNVESRLYSLIMTLHKNQLYLLEKHSESFKIWSAIIRINTEGKSLIMKFRPGH